MSGFRDYVEEHETWQTCPRRRVPLAGPMTQLDGLDLGEDVSEALLLLQPAAGALAANSRTGPQLVGDSLVRSLYSLKKSVGTRTREKEGDKG